MWSVLLPAAFCIRLQADNLETQEDDPGFSFDVNQLTMDQTIAYDCADGDKDPTCKMLSSFKVCGKCPDGASWGSKGGHHGGYMLCSNAVPQAAISIGIGGSDDWGIQVSRKYNITTYEYDCKDPTRPQCPPGGRNCRLEFSDVCLVGPRDSPGRGAAAQVMTMQELLTQRQLTDSDTLLLRIDLQGREWEVLKSIPNEELARFMQINVAFHTETTPQDPLQFEVAKKLSRDFTIIQTLGADYYTFRTRNENFRIPRKFQVSYLRNDFAVTTDQCHTRKHRLRHRRFGDKAFPKLSTRKGCLSCDDHGQDE